MKVTSALAILSMLLACTQGFLFGGGCHVSTWSPWEGPRGFDQMERHRTVLVPPSYGYKCPHLKETKKAPRPETTGEVSAQFKHDFLKPVELSNTQIQTRDLIIILDASGSIGYSNFLKAKNDIAELLSLMCPFPDPFKNSAIVYHQAAAIVFSDQARMVFDFNDKVPTAQLARAIRDIDYVGGHTCTGKAFQLAKSVFQSSRTGVRHNVNVRKEVLIVTDAMSNCGPNAVEAARDLKNTIFSSPTDKVDVFGLMIGNFTLSGQRELEGYVTSFVGNHLFALPGYSQLDKLVGFVRQQKLDCFPSHWYDGNLG